jgi:hypothetical protein
MGLFTLIRDLFTGVRQLVVWRSSRVIATGHFFPQNGSFFFELHVFLRPALIIGFSAAILFSQCFME